MNLARCGVELALRLTAPNGLCGFVSPASLLADQMSERLRHWVFREHQVHDIAYYAAEARLFEKVDQPSITLVASGGRRDDELPSLSVYDRNLERRSLKLSPADWRGIEENGYILPLQFGLSLVQLQKRWKHLPRVADLEKESAGALWAGRELDETGHQGFLGKTGNYLFVKGRMIQRFKVEEAPSQYVKIDGPKVPRSADYHRLVWRDVARPNQKRRMHATIIPPDWVTGNSLNVAYFRDENIARLKALLGVFNSLVFEAQIRAYLATGHVSLGSVRQVRIPDLYDSTVVKRLFRLVDRCLAGDSTALVTLEVRVARLYGLTRDDLGLLLSSFEKIGKDEVSLLLTCKEWETLGG